LDTMAVNGPDDVLDWDAIDWRLHEQNVVRLAAADLQGDVGAGLGHGPVSAKDDAAVLV
jgi:hypothetical protein